MSRQLRRNRPGRRRAPAPGRRVRRPRRRAARYRAGGLAGTLGLTALGTLLLGTAGVLAGAAWVGLGNRTAVLTAAVDPDKLLVAAGASCVLLAALVAVVVVTYRTVRRPHAPDGERMVEVGFVLLLCLLVAAPFALGARYAVLQRDLVSSVFAGDDETAVADGSEQVWGEDQRVNVLLLGGDGGVDRVGVRTDSVMVASMNARTGDTVLFGLPRNLQRVPFPPGSELAELYPEGFTGEGDPLEWMLNAVYGRVPELHPDLFPDSDNPGAQAVKQAVSGALGLPVDYYVLVNLRGFREMVDAVGGVTVNVNQPIPVGGNTDRGVPPQDYLEPGPAQHLNGFEALWFARGRYGLDDYNRMERQRCVVDAFIDEVDPMTLLRRYEALADTGKKIVRTDIPQTLVSSFLELGMELRTGDVRSVVFRLSERFNPNDPDFGWMRRKVDRTLAAGGPAADRTPPRSARPGDRGRAGHRPSPTPRPSPGSAAPGTAAADDPCAYRPVG